MAPRQAELRSAEASRRLGALDLPGSPTLDGGMEGWILHSNEEIYIYIVFFLSEDFRDLGTTAYIIQICDSFVAVKLTFWCFFLKLRMKSWEDPVQRFFFLN